MNQLQKLTKSDKVVKELKEFIESGELKSGTQIATVKELMAYYKISQWSVLEAMKDLAEQGYILKKPRSGYFVSEVKIAVEKEQVNHVQVYESEYSPLQKKTISVYVSDAQPEILALFTENFQKISSKLPIQISHKQFDPIAFEKEQPDIAILAHWQRQHLDKNNFVDLSKLQLFQKRLDELHPSLKEQMAKRTDLRGLPFSFALRMTFANESFQNDSQKVKYENLLESALKFEEESSENMGIFTLKFIERLMFYGCMSFTENGDVEIERSKLKGFFEQEARYDLKSNSSFKTSKNALFAFLQNKLQIYTGRSFNLSLILKESECQWKSVVPEHPQGKMDGSLVSVYINSRTPFMQECIDIAEKLTSFEFQLEYGRQLGNIPVYEKPLKILCPEHPFLKNIDVDLYLKQIVFPDYAYLKQTNIINQIELVGKKFYNKEISVDDAVMRIEMSLENHINYNKNIL